MNGFTVRSGLLVASSQALGGYPPRPFDVTGNGEISQEITKSHWVPNDIRPNCSNKACRFKFTLFKRQHHCRKCGEVFCNDCVSYYAPLSLLANFDPQGRRYKVCKSCYDENRDDVVIYRSDTEIFQQMRSAKKPTAVPPSGPFKSWRDRLNLEKECERLKEGFKKCVSSEVKNLLYTVEEMMTTPDWQKSSLWLMTSMSNKCQKCGSGFGLMRKKYCCKVCGVVLCKSCIHKELLIYLPDDVNDNTPTDIEVAIINIIGCPGVEPELSVLLHICTACREYVISVQEQRVRALSRSLRSEVMDTEEEVVKTLIDLDKSISSSQAKVVMHLKKYEEIIHSLDDGSRTCKAGDNTKILAKAQGDLSDHLATLSAKVPSIKQLVSRCTTDTQRHLVSNFLQAKSNFYLDNVNTFRKLKRKLADAAPPEVLEHIQKIVDKNAIVCTQICVRQLIFESIHLSVKHKLEDYVSRLLQKLDEVIDEEVEACLKSQGEDLEEHKHFLEQIVKQEMEKRRLIRLSRRLLQSEGPKHAADIIVQRLPIVLEKVKVQLELKSVDRSFRRTKTCLDTTLKQAQNLTSVDLFIPRK